MLDDDGLATVNTSGNMIRKRSQWYKNSYGPLRSTLHNYAEFIVSTAPTEVLHTQHLPNTLDAMFAVLAATLTQLDFVSAPPSSCRVCATYPRPAQRCRRVLPLREHGRALGGGPAYFHRVFAPAWQPPPAHRADELQSRGGGWALSPQPHRCVSGGRFACPTFLFLGAWCIL